MARMRSQYLRRTPTTSLTELAAVKFLRGAVLEVWGLFVTDGFLAIFTIAALLFVIVFIDRFRGDPTNAGLVLVAGVVLGIGAAILRAAGGKKAPEPAVAEEPALNKPALSVEPALKHN
jgi:hypothetical protein